MRWVRKDREIKKPGNTGLFCCGAQKDKQVEGLFGGSSAQYGDYPTVY
jgi:hypothetical protein